MNVDHIVRDLRVFADPATQLSHSVDEAAIHVRMIRNGEQRDIKVDRVTGAVVVRQLNSRQYSSLGSLLASDEFANIRALRATQRRLMSPSGAGALLDPEGDLEVDGTSARLTLDAFRQCLGAADPAKLRIVLLDGPAGVGKTSLIQRIVYERSDPHSEYPPLLHVTSSGSRLTDLPKALAHATQVLRSSVMFDQVPTLVRWGVLNVAIDGFDELVDPAGYKEAWSALREFLGDVGVGGPILLAGRDTFFDQQTFRQRVAERVPNPSLAAARLMPVSPAAAKEFLRTKGWSAAEVEEAAREGWLQRGSYYLRPFFLSQVAEEGGWSDLARMHSSPQAFLVQRFVRREAQLVSRMVSVSAENAESALWSFFELIVEDMTAQETDSVDESFLAFACEAAFADFLNGEDLAKLGHKAGSLGLLEGASGSGQRRFPHSEIQNQFLARAILSNLGSSSTVGTFLRRTSLTLTLLAAFSDALAAREASHAARVVERLQDVYARDAFSDRLSSNVLALTLSTLHLPLEAGPSLIQSGAATEGLLLGTPRSVRIEDVRVNHLDARGCSLEQITFVSCSVGTLTVDDSTVFGSTHPAIDGHLQVEEEAGLRTIRAPAAIAEWMKNHTAGGLSTESALAGSRLFSFFERVCRKFMRQRQIRDSDSDEAYFLVRDPLWPTLRACLGARLVSETRTAGGSHDVFFRLERPDKLLSPGQNDVEERQIRERIRAAAADA